jgi:hypothetical protein
MRGGMNLRERLAPRGVVGSLHAWRDEPSGKRLYTVGFGSLHAWGMNPIWWRSPTGKVRPPCRWRHLSNPGLLNAVLSRCVRPRGIGFLRMRSSFGVLLSMGSLVWHYTNGGAIDAIIESGIVDLARAGIGAHERPAAWFSTNPAWEASANRGNVFLKKRDYQPGAVSVKTEDIEEKPFDPDKMDREMGRFRIGVLAEAARHGWESFKKLSGIDKDVAMALERMAAEGKGNPVEWRVSFHPVERLQWRTVEKMVSGVWVRYVDLDPIRGSSAEGGRWGRS